MKKSAQINLRLDPPTELELTAVAESLGVSKSALVRRLTEAFLAEVKRTGIVKLSHEWTSKLTAADARSQWGERKTEKAVSTPPPSG
jgi:antitoxin component of RelBE/YafQ-DinJ toxin-antitoxin module